MGRLGAWREDLQEDISIEKWEEACTKAQSRTTNTRLKLLQYNWLMRTYITPEKLKRYNSTIPDICVKRKRYTFPLYLVMYGNTKILAGSETMHSKHFTYSRTLSPTAFILGLYPDNLKTKKSPRIFVDLSLLIAKRVIALSWKNTRRPRVNRWLSELSITLPLEKITYTLKHQQHNFHDIWDPFICYVLRTDLSHVMEEPGDM